MVKLTKYLGVLLSNEMSWTPHINAICIKARRLVGLHYRKLWSDKHTLLTLYVACPTTSGVLFVVWDLYLFKDVDQLESIQKFALKVCCKQWSSPYGTRIYSIFQNCPLCRQDEQLQDLLICTSLSTTLLIFQMHPSSTDLLLLNRNPLALELHHCRTSMFLNHSSHIGTRSLPAATVISTI